MPWARLDDAFLDHPKVLALGDEASDALHLWLGGLMYASRYLTDGDLPAAAVPRLTQMAAATAQAAAQALVRVGLWEADGDAYRIHDYLAYSPSKAQVLDRRRQDATRNADWRARHRTAVTNAGANGGANAGPNVTPYPTPTHTPTRTPPNAREEDINNVHNVPVHDGRHGIECIVCAPLVEEAGGAVSDS